MTLRLIDRPRPQLRLVSSPGRLAPRADHRYTAALVRVDAGLGRAADALGVPADTFTPVGEHSLAARFAVPAGTWRLWPTEGVALWAGERRGVMLPGAAAGLPTVSLPLLGAMLRLGSRGVRPRTMRLAGPDGGWGDPTHPADAYLLLSDPVRRPYRALRAVMADDQGLCGDVELTADGRALADDRLSAERFLALAAGLPDDTVEPDDLTA